MVNMVSRQSSKRWIAIVFIFMLLLFAVNLNGNIGLYILEQYENAATGKPTSNSTHPRAIHISYGEEPTQGMVILWASEAYSYSRVVYGTTKDRLIHKVSPSYQKITFRNKYGLRYWYRAELKGLTPDTKYYYKVLAGAHGQSAMYRFFTAPKKSMHFKPQFLVFGDLGLYSMGLNTILKEGLARQYDALLHLGDIAYNLESLEGVTGDNFLWGIEETAANVPYLTAAGDHEELNHFYSYRYRFSMPGVPWPMPEEKLWYSIDIGNVHLISYNTETYFHSLSNIGRQFLWLVDDLHTASKNRHIVPWIVVMGHKPLYCSQTFPQDCNSKSSKLRNGVEELFYTFGVDLVLQGHCHSYERSWPMYKGKVMGRHYDNPTAPVYITHGTTGNQYITDTIVENRYWSAFLMSETEKESFGRLQILNDTHLSWDTTLTSNGQVVDSFIMKKTHHAPNANIEDFIRKARANQTMEQLLLGQNLSVAKGDFSGWRTGVVLMLAFALVVLLFLFRVTVVDALETEVHRVSYFYRKYTGQLTDIQTSESHLRQI